VHTETDVGLVHVRIFAIIEQACHNGLSMNRRQNGRGV
jgi:hypothetical protein